MYNQLTKEKKAQIDILLEQGLSMRKVAGILGISHSTISRYKSGMYKKRKIDITEKYNIFLQCLYTHVQLRYVYLSLKGTIYMLNVQLLNKSTIG